MKRFKNLRRKIAITINVVLALQVISVGMFVGAGNAAAATPAVDEITILSPTEDQEIAGLNVTVSGIASLIGDEDDYRVKVKSDGESKYDYSFTESENSWSVSYSFKSNGPKSATVELQKKTSWNRWSYASATEPVILNFTLVYPAKPVVTTISGSLIGPLNAPKAEFFLDWERVDGADSYEVRYKSLGGSEVSSTSTISKKTISGLEVNIEYEFVVHAVHIEEVPGPDIKSFGPASEPVEGIVTTVSSLAVSPEFSNTLKFEVDTTEVENGTNEVDHINLYSLAPQTTLPYTLYGTQHEGTSFLFEAQTEGLYNFYTEAVDTEGYAELYKTCAVDEETIVGTKCIPDSSTIVDLTTPLKIKDLKAIPSEGQIALSWTDPADDTTKTKDVSGLDYLQVYRDGIALSEGLIAAGVQTFVDKTVDYNTHYVYTVKATDKAGNEGKDSNEAGVDSLAKQVLPAAPVNPPVITQAVSVNTISPAPVYYDYAEISQAPQTEGEVKSDTTDENKNEDEDQNNNDSQTETKEKRNVPLWGIIFLLILAGIGGYLFYTQSPEPEKKGKKKK